MLKKRLTEKIAICLLLNSRVRVAIHLHRLITTSTGFDPMTSVMYVMPGSNPVESA